MAICCKKLLLSLPLSLSLSYRPLSGREACSLALSLSQLSCEWQLILIDELQITFYLAKLDAAPPRSPSLSFTRRTRTTVGRSPMGVSRRQWRFCFTTRRDGEERMGEGRKEGRKEGRTDSPLVDYPLYAAAAAAAFSSSPFHHYSDRLYPPRNAREREREREKGGRFLRAKCAITTDRTNKDGSLAGRAGDFWWFCRVGPSCMYIVMVYALFRVG